MNGTRASARNRTQAETALGGVFVEGSLPPAKVMVRRSGGRLRGKVTDRFGHPVGETLLRLQRRVGEGWRPAAKSSTSTRGTFALRTRGRGPFRIVAALGGTTARNRAVR